MTPKLVLSFKKLSSKFTALTIATIFLALFSSNAVKAQYDNYRRPEQIVVPQWAPTYDNVNNVHYYYFPDYEIYFDVWANEFVYLDNGRWMFSQVLPPYLGNVDLDRAYVVMLDANIHQPWIHHNIYLSHYPRYYYHTIPSMRGRDGLRGYNENGRIAVYMNSNRRMDDHRVAPVIVPSNRQPQGVIYRGSSVGQPVVVQPYMREPHDRKYRDDRRHDDRRGNDRH